MPGIFDTPMSRKEFLATMASIAGTLCFRPGRVYAGADAGAARLALLADTHIPATPTPTNGYRGFVPADNLSEVVEQVVSSSAQVAILNGDAARSAGFREDYRTLKGLLQPIADKIPVHIGLGNHDDRRNFFEEFPQEPDRTEIVPGKHVSLFSLQGTRFVVLDSLLYVNKTAGLLGKRQREWLARFLEESDERPLVFFVHHTLGDYDGDLLDFDRVFRIMKPHRKVKAIFCGHAHSYHIEQREHVYVIQQPATGYNFSDAQPVGWLDASFSPQGVDLTLHAIRGNVEDDGKTTCIAWQ